MQLADGTRAPLTPTVDDNTVKQFARACIGIQNYQNQLINTVTGVDVMPDKPEVLKQLGEEMTLLTNRLQELLEKIDSGETLNADERNEILEKTALLNEKTEIFTALLKQYHDQINQLFASPREIPESSNDYWAVHLIGAFYDSLENNNKTCGTGKSIGTTCYVFGAAIEKTNQESLNIINEYLSSIDNPVLREQRRVYLMENFIYNTDVLIPRITLHEIGHCFGLDHSETGIMRTHLAPSDLLNSENHVFTNNDILLIQKNGCNT